MGAATTRLAYIDGWRVVAIALVFFDHLGMNRTIGAFYEASPFGVISQFGETGVFIFFFISGYVVSLTCLNEIDRSGTFSAPAFYARRFFRIVPPLMLYLLSCLALGVAGVIDFPIGNFVAASLYLCNTTALVSCDWYVGHTWSLAFEEQFYCLFPFVFGWLELKKRPGPALVPALLFALAPLVFTIWWIGKSGFFIAYALFYAGYLAAKHRARLAARLPHFGKGAIFAAALVVFMPRSAVAFFGGDEAAKANLIAYYRLLYIAAIPALVLLSGAADTRLRRLLENKTIAHLGRASYSIYLWQQLGNGPVFNDLGVPAQLGLTLGVIAFCLLLFPAELQLIAMGHALSKRLQERGAKLNVTLASARPVPGGASVIITLPSDASKSGDTVDIARSRLADNRSQRLSGHANLVAGNQQKRAPTDDGARVRLQSGPAQRPAPIKSPSEKP